MPDSPKIGVDAAVYTFRRLHHTTALCVVGYYYPHGHRHVHGCKKCTQQVVTTGHLMPLLAVTIQSTVVFRVLPSRRERLCFTTWMSVLKPRAAPPTLSQIHQRTQSGLLPS